MHLNGSSLCSAEAVIECNCGRVEVLTSYMLCCDCGGGVGGCRVCVDSSVDALAVHGVFDVCAGWLVVSVCVVVECMVCV